MSRTVFGRIPKPADWDSTQTLTVTLYFAVPSLSTSSIVNWRLEAASKNTNLNRGDANSAWDNLNFGNNEDGTPLNTYSAPSRTNMMKSQTFSTKSCEGGFVQAVGNRVSVFGNDRNEVRELDAALPAIEIHALPVVRLIELVADRRGRGLCAAQAEFQCLDATQRTVEHGCGQLHIGWPCAIEPCHRIVVGAACLRSEGAAAGGFNRAARAVYVRPRAGF